FTEAEIDQIMGQLVERLGSDGILNGYTLTEAADGRKSNALHEYEFKDKDDLRRFFTPHFKHVKVSIQRDTICISLRHNRKSRHSASRWGVGQRRATSRNRGGRLSQPQGRAQANSLLSRCDPSSA